MREITVGDLMTRAVITAIRETSIREIVAIQAARPGEAVPVIDASGRPVGMVSEADVLTKLEFHGGWDMPPLLRGAAARARWRKSAATTAGEVMTAPATCIAPDAGLTAAVRALATASVPGLCVIDPMSRLIGTVSRLDMLRPFLRDDVDLKTEVEQEIVGRGRAQDTICVEVADGIVTLDGALLLRSSADHACWRARCVPGVVAVDNHLRFQVDDLMITGL
ncbi:CBS domain-containing protein [Amycolatopsis mongoliensis]|uniref:CBS domain-containing protein n=1 Tax=Amycolatopsis mongoliensis TaxID=715475 RepID=A0A9Y2JNY4_9PSEU|nr:CBS domain-containing protein [Amycolatopsis sp. 4-36]WIY00936.1 CBS domain-containing protein [Amycolatopsis sp. 4-36]